MTARDILSTRMPREDDGYPADRFPEDREVAQLRIPPNSREAEQTVLGALLQDNGAWDRVGDLLTEADFYRHEHRLVYAAIGQLVNASRPADAITVFEQLERTGKASEAGGLPYLNELAMSALSATNARRYAEIVRERAVLRRLIATTDEIATSAFNTQGKAVDAIVDEAMRNIMAVSTDVVADEWVSMDAMMVQQLDRIQELADNPDGGRGTDFVPTGLDNLDELLDGGLRGGQFIVIGARPSMGKTAIADGIGEHVAMHEKLAVAKFSMEMQNSEGGQRALARAGGIPLQVLRRPHKLVDIDWQNITKGVDRLRQIPFYSNDRAALNINQVRAKSRALHRKTGKLGLIIVDYFQLMSGIDPRANRNTQLEDASRGLKALAKELNVPVIALAQVNRGVEKEGEAWEKQIPRMADLKDCGSLEQDADVILFLIRPSIAQKGLGEEWKPYARGELVKQRGGRTGSLDFLYEGKYTRYTAWHDSMPVPTSKIVTRGGGKSL